MTPESINESIKGKPPRKRSAGAPAPGEEEDSLRLANEVTPDMTVPEEVRRLWPEWLAYRTERHHARGREKLAWTPQTARMSAESIARACGRLPARVVADRIRAAIEGRWQGLNLDRLETPSGKGPGAGPASARAGGLRVVRGGGL